MKEKAKTLEQKHLNYAAPRIVALEVSTEGILCFSTERLLVDDTNPWDSLVSGDDISGNI